MCVCVGGAFVRTVCVCVCLWVICVHSVCVCGGGSLVRTRTQVPGSGWDPGLGRAGSHSGLHGALTLRQEVDPPAAIRPPRVGRGAV